MFINDVQCGFYNNTTFDFILGNYLKGYYFVVKIMLYYPNVGLCFQRTPLDES